jgi:polar amino acid transport system substrate-binding protein
MSLDVTSAARAELAPTGRLRAGINYGNFVLAAKDGETGQPQGIAPALARDIATRLNVPLDFVTFETAGRMADAVKTGTWDIAFLANEPERASEILFTAPYLEVEAGYLVAPGSAIQDVAEVDSPGIRIGIATKSAYDLFLTRTLRHAMLFRAIGMAGSYELFVSDRLDVLAGIKPWLAKMVEKIPASRVLDGRFMAVQQCIGTPQGRDAGVQFLNQFVARLGMDKSRI